MVKFSSDTKMKNIAELATEFCKKVLDDEEQPIFISDEATLLDVSTAEPEELLGRISRYYATTISVAELKQPLWKLILQLNDERK